MQYSLRFYVKIIYLWISLRSFLWCLEEDLKDAGLVRVLDNFALRTSEQAMIPPFTALPKATRIMCFPTELHPSMAIVVDKGSLLLLPASLPAKNTSNIFRWCQHYLFRDRSRPPEDQQSVPYTTGQGVC
jgi:hypothetical protein